jgi:Zinc carboxypeptidase
MGLEQMSSSMPVPKFLMDYIGYEELTRTLHQWARDHRPFVRLRSLAKLESGRDVWMLSIGNNPDDLRPAVCIDGNMHSAELLGTNAALCMAFSLIELHKGSPAASNSFAKPVRDSVLNGLYYIIPRVSPDGAEELLTAGRISRSAPRQRRRDSAARWIRSDVDADGRIRQIRMKHAAGEFVQHPHYPHVLVARTIQDEGPFFTVFPEGYIEGFDGKNVPFPHTLSDNDSDFNRNFPFDWSSDHEGAGRFPGWEPETRALIEFATNSPHIFAWLNLHTFGGIFIRPPFSNSRHEMNREDLLVYEQAAALVTQYTGMPTLSAFEEMTPVASQPMTGTLAAWAYGEQGCFAWAVELWDLFGAVGLSKRTPYFRNYAIQEREEISLLVEWDVRENEGRVFGPWRPFVHPQLGDVEIGGIDPVRGVLNPPEKEIAPICERLASFAIALASLAPRLQTRISTAPVDENLTKINLVGTNSGYLPTYVSAASQAQPWNRGLQVSFQSSGCALVSGESSADVGHLRGWGRGAHEEGNAPFFQKSQGVHDVAMTWIVKGSGQVQIEIGAPRTGWCIHKLDVGR